MLMPIDHKQTVEEVEEVRKFEIPGGPHPTAGMDLIPQRPVIRNQTKGIAITGALRELVVQTAQYLCSGNHQSNQDLNLLIVLKAKCLNNSLQLCFTQKVLPKRFAILCKSPKFGGRKVHYTHSL